MDKVVYLCSRIVIKKIVVACTIGFLVGCGAKKGEAENTTAAGVIKTPATVEQAARVLDLSTFPLMDGAKAAESRHVAHVSYIAPGDPKKALEFHRKAFGAQCWKELPNSTISDESASAMFAHDGFVVSLSVIPFETTGVSVRLQNLGNIRPGKLPVPANTKPIYVRDSTVMYATDASVPATVDAIRNLFVAQGWVPYGKAGDSHYFKQNAIVATATVWSAAAAEGRNTVIQYSNQLISADIPAPPKVEDLRYVDEPPELTFVTTNQDAIVGFYRKALADTGWKSTMDKMIELDEKPTMIFRNAANEMLTLATTGELRGKVLVSVRFQTAAEIAELQR